MKRNSMAVAVFTVVSWICCINAFAADLEITAPAAQAEQDIIIACSVNNAPNAVYVFGFDISYDAAMLQYKSHSFTGSLAENFEYSEVNPYSTGNIRVGGMDTGPNIIVQNASGTIVNITFRVLDAGNTQVSIRNRMDDMETWTIADAQIFSKDAYEPDNFYPQSGVIDKVQRHNFHETGDADWGMIYGTAGKSYTLRTINPESNCDTVIELYAIDGQTLILSENSSGAGVGESITWNCTQDTIYFVKIRNNNSNVFGEGTGYDLSVEYPDTFDAYEPDDTSDQARDIIVDFRPQTHGFLSPGDEDWVQFDAVTGENYTIEMNPLESCDIAIELYGVDSTSVRRSGESLTLLRTENSAGPGEGEVLIWQCTEEGRYYIRFIQNSAFAGRRSGECYQTYYEASVRRSSTTLTGILAGGVNLSSGEPVKEIQIKAICTTGDCSEGTGSTNDAGCYQILSRIGSYNVTVPDIAGYMVSAFVTRNCTDGQFINRQENISYFPIEFQEDYQGICIDIEMDCTGDVNGKEGITPQDALDAFNKYMRCSDKGDESECVFCCDVNKDGSCSPADALCIFRKYLGKPGCLD